MPNGSSPWFKFRCVPVYGENEDIIGVGVSWSDISKEKNLVKELEDAAIKYKAIIDSTEDRHVLIDLNNKLLAFNKSALKNLGSTFGFEMKEGDDFVEYFKGHEHVFKLLEGIAATHKNETYTYESCVEVPGDRCRWLRILYLPVKNNDGELIGTALNWTDISAQKHAQEQIGEHVKQLEEFSHITSHKLRQPLANIIGLTNLIANAETPADEKEQLVAKLKTVADGLDAVIKEMTEAVAVLSFNKKQVDSAIKPLASNSVFIIDDDPINNIITKKLLQRCIGNVAVKEFLSPAVALDELSKGNKPDLILLDINMEPMDGWGFLKEFEKLNLGVPIVMCSSSVDPADFSRAQEHPLIAEFFSKPLTEGHIKALLLA
jgi:PAS domain S-box-containing protein